MQNSDFLKFTKLSMLLVGLWPVETKNMYLKSFYNCTSLTSVLAYALFIVTLTAGIVEVETSDEFIVNYLIYILFHGVVFWKIILTQSKEIKLFAKKMVKECKEIKSENHQVYKSVTNYNHNLFLVISLVSFLVFGPFILLEANEVRGWETKDYYKNCSDTRQLKMKEYFPFNKNDYFEFAFSFQVFMGVWGTLYNYGCESYFFSLVNFALLKLKMLNYNLEHFKWNCKVHQPKDVVKRCVLEHRDIISFVDGLDRKMKWFYFADFISKSYYLSMLIFATVTASTDGVLTMEFVFAVGCVFLVCGQLLCIYYSVEAMTLEGLEVGTAIYKSNWYEQPRCIQSSFVIIMQMSQRPIQMHIGHFGIIGNGSFIKVMKAAYSCLVFVIKG